MWHAHSISLFFFEQIGGKLVSKHRCFGAALPTLSGTTTNKSSYAWLNESPPHPAPSLSPPPSPLPGACWHFSASLPSRESLLPPPRHRHKSNVRSTTCDTLQRNKQIKVRTADCFFEVMAFAVVTTSGRANKWTVSWFSLSTQTECLLVQVGQFQWPWCQMLYKGCTLLHLKCQEEAARN